MMQHILKTFVLSALISGAALADDMPDFKSMSPKERQQAVKNMSSEERKAFRDARKEKWDSMSKEEKVNLIEKKRSKAQQRREEKWNSLSDDEKINRAEKMMKKRKERIKERRSGE